MDKLTIIGNVGKDPEQRFTPQGKAVTNYSVAVNRKHGEVKETVWFRVTSWERQAENDAKYLRKGSKVYVEGRLTIDPATGGPRTWTRQDGATQAGFEITANFVEYLSAAEPSPAGGDVDADFPVGSTYGAADGEVPF